MVDYGEQDPNVTDCDYLLHDQTVASGTTKTYSTSCSITAGPNYTIEDGANITLQAGTHVTFKAGFTFMTGGEFHGIIQ